MNTINRVRRRNPATSPAQPLSLAGIPHSCGDVFELVREPADIQIRGTIVRVDRELFRCCGCGGERQTLEQIDAERERAAEKLRLQEGILSPAEIRELRDSLALSQAELERALGLGPKTVVRWESGKVMPNQATSALLLLIRRDPSALEFLASRRGLRVEPAPAARDPAVAEQTLAFRPAAEWRVRGRSAVGARIGEAERRLRILAT